MTAYGNPPKNELERTLELPDSTLVIDTGRPGQRIRVTTITETYRATPVLGARYFVHLTGPVQTRVCRDHSTHNGIASYSDSSSHLYFPLAQLPDIITEQLIGEPTLRTALGRAL